MSDDVPTETLAVLHALIDGQRIESAGRSYELRLTDARATPGMAFVVAVSTGKDRQPYATIRFFGRWTDNAPAIIEQLKTTVAILTGRESRGGQRPSRPSAQPLNMAT
jgi:hypothetical protein